MAFPARGHFAGVETPPAKVGRIFDAGAARLAPRTISQPAGCGTLYRVIRSAVM
jgi:hypothetical protein